MKHRKHQRAIMFAGGGTLGSVAPLLAIIEKLKQEYPGTKIVWCGTFTGIERRMIPQRHITYIPICNGKWRRYFSLFNLIDPLLIILGILQALVVIAINRPRVVVAAGAYVAVPCAWACALCRIPIIALQLDHRVGLANRLVFPFATTKAFAFPDRDDGARISIPVRNNIMPSHPERATLVRESIARFNLREALPTLLVMGGGIGSIALNRIIRLLLPQLLAYCNILHATGTRDAETICTERGYHSTPFLGENLPLAYAVADLLVARAGMSTIAEASAAGLPLILIPLPHSAQEENAQILASTGAARVIPQSSHAADILLAACKQLLTDKEGRKRMVEALQSIVMTNSESLCQKRS